MRTNSPCSSLISNSSPPSVCSSTLQEGDGVRKSGPIVLLNKKKGQSLYAVLSERALELHESEKAQRKKKGTKSIVDLSKCFNVSQQSCPKSRSTCVCLLMPDECFALRSETETETSDWYSSLLFAVISARALRLGRPVFANEFFECVWDVTVWPTQPKLKIPPQNPDNSPNICAKLQHLDLKGKKRLCFYPHTIILCNVGIEPALNGLPKSGIPPFRTIDFVEFSRHYIASYGSQEKFFIMRIGRGSPMGSCEAWIQCESEETAAEVKNKLADIIRRETEKKQCALLALGSFAKGSSSANGTISQQQRSGGTAHHHHQHNHASSSSSTPYAAQQSSTGSGTAPNASADGQQISSTDARNNMGRPDTVAGGSAGGNNNCSYHQQNRSPELETISEDVQQQQQQQQQQFPGAEQRSPATSVSSSNGGVGANGAVSNSGAGNGPQQRNHHNHHHHHLSQSAREKRLELRECKAKVDSLEEEEQRFREQQQQSYCAAAIANGESRWRLHNLWAAATGGASGGGSVDSGAGASIAGVCMSARGGDTLQQLSHSQSRPAYLGCVTSAAAAMTDSGGGGKLFRRQGSANSMDNNNMSALRAKSASLEQHQQQQQQLQYGCGRNWCRKSPLEISNNGINDFDTRWINRTDSLNMLGAGVMGNFFYGAEEETEDSGGTLRIPCGDGEENNSQENSRSASSLNLSAPNAAVVSAQASTTTPTAPSAICGGVASGGCACIVEALVECHATAGEELSGDELLQQQTKTTHCATLLDTLADDDGAAGGTSTEEEEDAAADDGKTQLMQRIDLATVRRRRKQQQQHQHGAVQQPQHDEEDDGSVAEHRQQRHQQKQQRQRQQQLVLANTESSSQEAADEADQSCCSSSIASSSSVTCREEIVMTAGITHLVPAVSSSSASASASSALASSAEMPGLAAASSVADPSLALSALKMTTEAAGVVGSAAAAVAVDEHDYTTMDKVSCSSDSFSHLAVPHQWDRQHSSVGCCQEEICSCASDSGDSCYSSMANGQLNPRAFSFSSTTDGSAVSSGIGCGGGGGTAATVSATACAARSAASAAAAGRGCTGRADGRHWTMGVVSGVAAMQQHHRNCAGAGSNCHFAQPTHHFASPRCTHQQQMSTSVVLPGNNSTTLIGNNNNNNNCSNTVHNNSSNTGAGNCWPPDSSSSSRFSMETSLITPLEEDDEKHVGFGDEEERDKLCTEISQRSGTELRKRAFSLGSKSWITKPFRKLSQTHHGVGANGSTVTSAHYAHHHHQHHQQNAENNGINNPNHHHHHHYQHNQQQHRQLHSSESARSCTSSLAGSVHGDLSCSTLASAADQQQHQQQAHNNSSSQTRLSHRLGSTSSFASCSITGHQNRSDSVGSSHSVAFSLPGSSLLTQKLLRKKQPSDDHLRSDDLVELEFMPQKKQQSWVGGGAKSHTSPAVVVLPFSTNFAHRSAQCVPSTVIEDTLRNSPRARTSSCDEHNQQHQHAMLHQLHQAQSTPTGMTVSGGRASVSSAALDGAAGSGNGKHHQQQHQPQRHHFRTAWGSGTGDPTSAAAGTGTTTRWTSHDNFPMLGQHPHSQQQQQKLRPSESFIRSVQQQEQEMKQQQQKNTNNSRMQQRRQKKRSDFPLQEVQCFIAPAEREKIDAVTSRGDRDSLSMRSQRSGSGSTFETIQEYGGTVGQKRDSRASNRRPSSRPSSSIASADSQSKLHQMVSAVDEDEYVLSSNN